MQPGGYEVLDDPVGLLGRFLQYLARREGAKAFGKTLSFKDPERAKLCERLDRWIEKDFSKTAKGKSALKQGAARRCRGEGVALVPSRLSRLSRASGCFCC